MIDRRMARRYDLSLPAVMRVGTESEAASSKGRTRDISARGVYLVIDNAANAGAEVNLAVTLSTPGGIAVLIRAVGKVVRVEKWSENGRQRVGLGATIMRYEIVRNE